MTGEYEDYETSPDKKALEIVNRDYGQAKQYLSTWHKSCNERYQHYRAAGLDSNILGNNKFPIPFTSEQVDQLRADMIEKLWYKNKPCSIYGRNEADRLDAAVKSDFMEFLDKQDDIYSKMDQAIVHCALYGISPAVVNFKHEEETRMVEVEKDVEVEPGVKATDIDGNVQRVQVEEPQKVTTFQGASVELVDPIDFFFTKEKRNAYDEYPMMIRSFRSMDWFKSKSYINNLALNKLRDETPGSSSIDEDLLANRRHIIGFDSTGNNKINNYEYVEWHGYGDFDGTGRALWIIGVIRGEIVARMDKNEDVFRLGHPNIVIGNIDREYGEIRGQSLLDKIHSLQHAMDTLMGIYLQNLQQSVNRMWIGNSNKMKTKRLINKPGFFIDTEDRPDDVIKAIESAPISRDIYDGMALFRQIGQHSSGISDISEGVAQAGVETLGEANILNAQGGLRIKRYLKTFETSFIQPLWEMRNQINMIFVKDPGYLYSVVEEDIVNWRVISPAQIRANVDFICEASNRENQRAVITQQVLQALNIITGMIPIIGPIPAIKLLEKMYRDAFGWKEDDIKELLPAEEIINQMMQNQMMQQMEAEAKAGKMVNNPREMSQPKSETEAIKSSVMNNYPGIGVVK